MPLKRAQRRFKSTNKGNGYKETDMAKFDVTIRADGQYLHYVAQAKLPRTAAAVVQARRKERELKRGTVCAVSPIPECVPTEGKALRKR